MDRAPATSSRTGIEATTRDDTLMIDIDFFDANGRFSPNTILFSPREDSKRASSLWTKLFGGLMAFRGKIWAKNYLATYFQGKEEATAMLSTIRNTQMVRKSDFLKTVAECTLRYKPLPEAESVETTKFRPSLFLPRLVNLPCILFDHIASIDWEKLNAADFNKVSLPMLDNLRRFIDELEPDPVNDKFIEKIEIFRVNYQLWMGGSTDVEGAGSSQVANIIFAARDKLLDDIKRSVLSYQVQCRQAGKLKAQAVSDHADLVADIKRQAESRKLRPMYSISIFGEMERNDLIKYLEFGEHVFTRYTNFGELGRLLSMSDTMFKSQINFTNSDQFEIFMTELRRLKADLPRIQSRYARVKEDDSDDDSIEEELFEQDTIDISILKKFDPENFNDWSLLSEESVRKILVWIASLNVEALTPLEVQVVDSLMSMGRRLKKWVESSGALRLNAHVHLEDAAKSLINACLLVKRRLAEFNARSGARQNQIPDRAIEESKASLENAKKLLARYGHAPHRRIDS